MVLSNSLGRADKLLSEANSRSLGEAWRERHGRARAYIGPLAVSKCIPQPARERFLGSLNRGSFTRLAAGSQQIVLVPDYDTNTVMKIDRTSLGLRDPAQCQADIEQMTRVTQEVTGGEFLPPFCVATAANPMRYGGPAAACIYQGRVFNARDVFELSPGERARLTPGIKERLATLGCRIMAALDAGDELLPELIGRNNLVVGNLAGSPPDVWLVDTLAANRSKLETTCGPRTGIPDINVYHHRVSMLLDQEPAEYLA